MAARLGSSRVVGTFAERGVFVPFTSPALSAARVRCGRLGALEFVMPSLSGGKGVYVLPGGSLAEVVRMSLHDRMLHDMLGVQTDALTPEAVERCALAIAATGVAGAEAQTRALDERKRIETDGLRTHVLMIEALLARFPDIAAGVAISAQSLGGSEGRALIRDPLRQVAARLGLAPRDLYDRIETWSRLIAAAGLPNATDHGRLRRCRRDVGLMAEILTNHPNEDRPDNAAIIAHCAIAAGETAMCAARAERRLDTLAAHLPQALRQWDKTEAQLRRSAGALAMILDGWRPLVAQWHDARDKPARDRHDSLARIASALPILPAEAMDAPARPVRREYGINRRRWLVSCESWLTGIVDSGLAKRNEGLRRPGDAAA